MRKFKYFGIIILIFVSISCDIDEHLDKTPLDQITDVDFWKTPNDLKLYVNQFYTMLPRFPVYGSGYLGADGSSDNMGPASFDRRLAGLATLSYGNANWNFGRLRNMNIFLANYDKVDAPDAVINPHVGAVYFFRAYFYFNLLRNYGDVPWVDKPLNVTSDELYNARTQRSVIVDNILDDLSNASTLLPPRSRGTSINKEAALLFKSRVALYEGTWHKYHQGTPFGVSGSNGEKYLQVAAEAARELMDMKTIEIYTTGEVEYDYMKLFSSDDLSNISEAILWVEYDADLELSNHVLHYLSSGGWSTGVTKSLIDSYLCIDGLPISLSPLYEGDKRAVDEVVVNRDHRLRQVIWVPGETIEILPDEVRKFKFPALHIGGENRNTTGYQLQKGYDSKQPGQIPVGLRGETANIIFRYAEALLNYAEAKAELGTITQTDIDESINLIRARAGMPDFNLATIVNDPNWDFPELSPIINEIRRERRVELACEGYRPDDLMRWRGHDLIVGKRPLGAWFDPTFWTGEEDEDGKYINGPLLVPEEKIYLDDEGYIDYLKYTLPDGYKFNPDRDYLLPLPPAQITLNENLAQNPGW